MLPVLSQRQPRRLLPFNPLTGFTGLVSWYDATQQSASGGHLTSNQVTDFSGAAHHLTAGNDPLLTSNQLNGFPAILFRKASSQYAQGTFTLTQPVHLFVLCKTPTSAVASNETLWDGAAAGNSMRVYYDTIPNYQQYANGFGAAQPFDTTAYHLHELIYNGSSSKYRLDRGSYVNGSGAADSTPGGVTIAAFQSLAAFADEDFVSMIICSSIQDDNVISRYQGYIKGKFGI